MAERDPQADSRPDAAHDSATLTSRTMRQASALAHGGDFRAARRLLQQRRAALRPSDRIRLDALAGSFRLDPAALAVAGVTLIALVSIGSATLFPSS